MLNSIKLFLISVFEEYKKVSWVPFNQTILITFLVIVLVIIISVYVGFIDFVLSYVVGIFLGR